MELFKLIILILTFLLMSFLTWYEISGDKRQFLQLNEAVQDIKYHFDNTDYELVE